MLARRVGCSGLWLLPLSYGARALVTLIVAVLAAFLIYEAWASHQLLGEIRAELLKGITVLPAEGSSTRTTAQTA
jgi:hypothetical protein